LNKREGLVHHLPSDVRASFQRATRRA
jgi:hypothetical protein